MTKFGNQTIWTKVPLSRFSSVLVFAILAIGFAPAGLAQSTITGLEAHGVPQPRPVNIHAAEAALEIFELLDQGAQTGNWSPFLARVRDDVTWWAPVEGFQGYHKGKASLEALFAHHTGATRTEWTLNNVLVNGNEIAIEARVEGEIMEKRYANQLLMLWRIDERGRIVQMREYAGFINGVGDLSGVGDVSSGRDAFDYLED